MLKILLFVLCTLHLGNCDEVTLEIDQGKLVGKTGLDRKGHVFYSFLSIPYAKSPVGDLRFKPPQEPEKWDGVLNATNDMPVCSQVYFGKAVGQEDCLFLNIHTPKIPSNDQEPLLPVFFFIHGGAFIEGSGHAKYFGGEFLVPAGVVVVTINYRLGLFGFVSSVDESLGVSGNAGLKDQNMALRWVQKNVRKFGGDPNNVMIVGESAGGASVHFHLLSPASKGLFHKVISMSGTALNSWAQGPPGTLEILGRRYLGVGSNDSKEIFQALKGLSTTEVLKWQKIEEIIVPVDKDLQSSPVVEKDVPGAFITSPSLQIIKDGNYNKVPFMFGYTNRDGLVIEILHRLTTGKPYIVDDFSVMVPKDLNKESKDKIKTHYFGDEKPSLDNLEKSVDMFGGVYILSGISKVLDLQSRTSDTPMYFYRISADTKLNYFKQLTPETAKVKGTSHIDDLGYLFKTEKTPEIEPGSPEDLAIDNIVTLFTNFAKFGKPSDDWLPLTSERNNYMEIGISGTPGTDPDKEEFKFWSDLYKNDS